MADRVVRRALNEWRQGDLVAGTRLFWAAPLDDPLTGLQVDGDSSSRWPVVVWDGTPAAATTAVADVDTAPPDSNASRWSIITSQTCDVVATGPGARHPTVQVSPLRDLRLEFDAGQITEIRRGSRVDLVYVPNVPGGGDWAADLRVSLPVSKAVLLEQTPQRGFGKAKEALEFGERVAAKVRRPALHDQISDGLVNSLREFVKVTREAGEQWPDLFEQFRLLVTDGDKLQPKSVALLAITHGQTTGANRQPLRGWQRTEKRRLARASDGILLTPVRFYKLDELGARDYRDSDPLRVPELGSPAFW
jgi:hypothetical protein